MARYAEWYAVELDGYLKGRISDVSRFEAIKEVTNHFAEHVDDLVAKGMDPVEAEKAAIKSFGSPKNAALNLMERSKGRNLGSYFTMVGCLAIIGLAYIFGTIVPQVELRSDSSRPFGPYFIEFFLAFWIVLAIGLISGIFMTKRVPALKMLISGVIGVTLALGNFMLTPTRNFAGIPPEKFESTMTKWLAARDASTQMSKINESIMGPSRITARGHEEKPLDSMLALERIKTEAPKMLAIRPTCAVVDGKLTAGYLGPATMSFFGSHSDYGSTIERQDVGEETRYCLSGYLQHLQYYKTSDEALTAWGQAAQSTSMSYFFTQMANEQHTSLTKARAYFGLSKTELMTTTMGPFVASTFGIILSMIFVGWLLTKVPNLTVQSSFRRRIA